VAPKRNTGSLWYLVVVGTAAVILVIGLIALQPHGDPLTFFIRGAALLGYLAVFLSILSSATMKQMHRVFGRPFVKMHHVLTVTGLILMTLHPLGVALDWKSPQVLLPRFDSWSIFLQWGGPPAWYLVGLASLAAVLRKTIGKHWRVVHFLNYVAFLLGTVHAIKIGTDLQRGVVRAALVILALVVVATFIQKRFRKHGH
jgi:sulfoxide reductase heme-binding subunit YedZ